MRNTSSVPPTITEAQLSADIIVIRLDPNATQSSSRIIPYAEMYRGRSSVMETPVERIQKAAKDEERRKAVH